MSTQLDSDGTGSPIASALAHSRLIAAGTVLGAVVGAGAGYLLPTSHTAETRLAVGAGNSSAYAIAGYPMAARDLAQNYSRWVQNNAADGTWAYPGLSDVTVTPIPESGVIRVVTAAPDPSTAAQGASHIADRLLTAVGELEKSQNADAALAEYRKLTPPVATAQAEASMAESAFGRSPTAATAQALAAARTKLSEAMLIRDAAGDRYRRLAADPSSVSQLTTISPPASTGDNKASNIGLGVGGGAGVGLLGAFAAAALIDARRDQRRRERRARDGRQATTHADVAPPSVGVGNRRSHGPDGGTGSGTDTGTTAGLPADVGAPARTAESQAPSDAP